MVRRVYLKGDQVRGVYKYLVIVDGSSFGVNRGFCFDRGEYLFEGFCDFVCLVLLVVRRVLVRGVHWFEGTDLRRV